MLKLGLGISLTNRIGSQSAGDPDAADYISRAEANGGGTLATYQEDAITDFIEGCKADPSRKAGVSNWQASYQMAVLSVWPNIEGALTLVKGTAPVDFNDGFVSGDYDTANGLQGDGVKSLKTGVTQLPQDNHSLLINLASFAVSSGFLGIGGQGFSGSFPGEPVHIAQDATTTLTRSNTSSAAGATRGSTPGLTGVVRETASEYYAIANGTTVLQTGRTSTTPQDSEFTIFSRNGDGDFFDGEVNFYVLGEAIDEQALITRLDTLFAAASATAPAQMGAPSLVGGDEEATLTLNTAVIDDGGNTVTEYNYEVTDSTDTGFASPVAQGTQSTENFGDPIILTPLAPDDYIARNRAVNAVGDGAWSVASAAETVTGTGDITPPVTNTNSYDDPTSTITVDVNEDSTWYWVLSTTDVKPSEAQMIAGQESDGSAAALFGSFSVSGSTETDEDIDTSSVPDGTYYYFGMPQDTAGNNGDVEDSVTVVKSTPTLNYVDQTGDARLRFGAGPVYNQDYWFVAMSIQASNPESTSSARLYETTTASRMFYVSADSEISVLVSDGGATLYSARYPLDLSTLKHFAFKYDGITGTPTFWVDGVVVAASSVFTSATAGSLSTLDGLYILDNASGNRSVRADQLSQLVVANADLDISDVWNSTFSQPRYDLSGFSAELKMGQAQKATNWDAGTNLGTKSGLVRDNGTFTDVV